MRMFFVMKRGFYIVLAMCIMGLGVPAGMVKADEDVTPPTVSSFTVSSQNVDVTTTPQVISVEVQATDDISGISTVSVRATAPGNNGNDLNTTWATEGPSTWSGTMQVPQYIANGEWTLTLFVIDAVGNSTYMEGQVLVDNGYPGFIQVTSNEDLEAPIVQSVNVNPDTVDVTTTPKIVEVRVQSTDNVSGIVDSSFIFSSPNSQNSDISVSLTLSVDEQGNEEWIGTASVPQYIGNGDWPGRLIMSDRVGNTTYMESDDLAAAGFDHKLTVISNPDVTPPTVESLDFTPDTVDVSSSPQEVVARAKSLDELSGVSGVHVILTSPSGEGYNIIAVLEQDVNAAEEGMWVGVFHFPQFIEAGEWTARLVAVDKVGNTLAMNPAQLAAAGFDNKVTVTNSPSALVGASVSPLTNPSPILAPETALP